MDVASKKAPKVLNHYLMKYVNDVCLQKGEFNDAL